ncbi:hypothetical protein SLEP1_g1468 [Rubroshorea leprosula]|uniref:BZIP domain-containing protein n=1 Tax=Rubroshorea leprosula TaxID=152421 RepID=A0AAV5HNF9_9ROSI|nr:hypothetical protein SLEP1_g1468 [Rubroshorea leprosula]
MAPVQQQLSSGSDTDPRYEVIDERKRKRMLSNRESAKRSRMKKQKQLEDLLNEVNTLKNENSQLVQSISIVSQRYAEIEGSNNILRAQAMELTERLESLNSMLQILGDDNSLAMDIPEGPESLMEPWQLPCLVQPIMASEMFHC